LGALPRLTARPDTFGERVFNSSVVWLALNAIWAGADVLLALYPSGGRPYPPDDAASHLIFTIAGVVAILCMHRTGFPAAWDVRYPAARRIALPLIVGVAFGLLASAIDLITGASKILAEIFGTPFNVGFPGSLFASVGGAVKFEAIFLIIPVPILLWLISNVILRGRGQAPTFWILAVISSLLEPVVFQGVPLFILAQGAISLAAFLPVVVDGFGMNFSAAYLFRRYGLLAAVLVRLGHYLIWHVGYGLLFP
jgi:hypothetical protein